MPPMITELFQTQGDYCLLLVVTLLVIAAATFGIRRFRPAAHFPWSLWALALLVLAFGWVTTQQAGEHAREESIALVSAMAPTYAAELEQRGHSRITEATRPDDPLYLELIQAQIQWEKLNPFAHDIYTFRKRADGTNILVVDSETDYDHSGDFLGATEARTPIGKIYPQAVKGLEKAYLGEANFDAEIYDDEWGTWVSAFVPMRDASGKVEAVLGVDFDARSWLVAIAKARRGSIWVTALLLAIILGAGTAIALLRADIAQRAHAESLLRESQQRLLLTIRQMPLGFIEWDAEANVVIWNPAAEKIFGHTADAMLGKKAFPFIVPPAAASHVDAIWQELLRGPDGNHSINENQTKDGRTIVCEWFNTALVGADDKVVAVFSLFQDITERVNFEKSLQQSERLNAIGQLAAGIAHDFNNILTIITGHAGLLFARGGLPPDALTDVERIEAAALRAAGLTRQLLAFSRRQAMFSRPLALGKVVESTTTMLARLIRADVKFLVHIAHPLPPIEADPAMLEQVITNLVLNARDAVVKGGEISVTADTVTLSPEAAHRTPGARAGLAVRLSIHDTGAGIAPEVLPRIFEPFFTTKATGQGTGLGLAVVHGIVQQHGGWITVESSLTHGATFHVFFSPTKREVIEEASGKKTLAPATVTHHQHTILLVEDEPGVRELARLALERAGFQVQAAGDGPQALQLWQQHRDEIDLLLTDMVMPNGLNGRELAQRLHAERPDLPVIYASGYSIDFTAPTFAENEPVIFLPKPYQPQQLVEVVRRSLGQIG